MRVLLGRTLERIRSENHASLYHVSPALAQHFNSFVVSTPSTRLLTTNPFLSGQQYRSALLEASLFALRQPEVQQPFQKAQDEQLNVLHFLRGGLSFQVMDALGKLGWNNTNASFMSSERIFMEQDGEKHWKIHKDQYIELTLKPQSILFIGDICATGSTLNTGLAKVVQQYSKRPKEELPPFVQQNLVHALSKSQETFDPQASVQHVLYITLGCPNAEHHLLNYHQLFQELFPDYTGTTAIFIEGIFHMADQQQPRYNPEIGTDLIPGNNTELLAPEYKELLHENPLIALEQCIVYDGGSRAFNPTRHYHLLEEYAHKVEETLQQGKNAFDLLQDRWSQASELSQKTITQLQKPETGHQWVKQRLNQIQKMRLQTAPAIEA